MTSESKVLTDSADLAYHQARSCTYRHIQSNTTLRSDSGTARRCEGREDAKFAPAAEYTAIWYLILGLSMFYLIDGAKEVPAGKIVECWQTAMVVLLV